MLYSQECTRSPTPEDGVGTLVAVAGDDVNVIVEPGSTDVVPAGVEICAEVTVDGAPVVKEVPGEIYSSVSKKQYLETRRSAVLLNYSPLYPRNLTRHRNSRILCKPSTE